MFNAKLVLASTIVAATMSTPVASGPLDDLNDALKALETLGRIQNNAQTQDRGSSQTTGRQPTREDWRKVQARLNALGYNAGPVDGQPGKKTRQALANFESRNGLRSNGTLDAATSRALFSRNAVAATVTAQTEVTNPLQPVEVQNGASFDCGAAATQTEVAICSSAVLSELDGKLSTVYGLTKDQPQVATSQREWLKERDSCGSSAICIEKAYTDRLSVLVALSQTSPQGTSGLGTPVVVQAGSKQPIEQVLLKGGQARFYGSASCGAQGRKRDITFLLNVSQKSGSITATLVDFYRWSMSGTSKTDTMVGEYRQADKTLALARDRKTLHAIDWLGRNIILIDIKDLTFDVGGADCQNAQLNQIDVAPEASPGGAGSYFMAGTRREKCEAITTWLEHSSDLWDPGGNDRGRNIAKLHVDDLFVPVFGVPADRLSEKSYSEMMKIGGRHAQSECYKEPFVADRFSGVQIYLRVNDRTKPYIDWYVRQQRSLASDLAERVSTDPNIFNISSVYDLGSKDVIDEFLSGKDKAELSEKIVARKAEKADIDADAALAELQTMPVDARLLKARGYRKRQPEFAKHLSEAGKDKFQSQIETSLVSSAQEVFGAPLLQIQFLPRTVEGLKEASGVLESTPFQEVSQDLSDMASVSSIVEELEGRKGEISSVFAAEIETFEATRDGLAASLDWIERLDSRLAGVLDTSQQKTLEALWDTKRDQLLADALPKFEEELLVSDDANALMARYVSEKHDAFRPVLLEYELTKALYE